MMFVLVLAKSVGDFLSPSFDHGMMHVQHLPFLEEQPPREFNILTARDVMARSVVVLKEVCVAAASKSHEHAHGRPISSHRSRRLETSLQC